MHHIITMMVIFAVACYLTDRVWIWMDSIRLRPVVDRSEPYIYKGRDFFTSKFYLDWAKSQEKQALAETRRY